MRIRGVSVLDVSKQRGVFAFEGGWVKEKCTTVLRKVGKNPATQRDIPKTRTLSDTA
jgi:hypothetical protein